jgi:hypothetical protein
MIMRFATDYGRPIPRAFCNLPTADGLTIGAVPPDGSQMPSRIWVVGKGNAHVLGIVEPQQHRGTWASLAEGQDPQEAIATVLAATTEGRPWTLSRLNLPPGRYFARMARPDHQNPGIFPSPFPLSTPPHAVASASTQVSILADSLRRCFQVVTPTQANFRVFGAEIRNILLLAATEFEAQCRAILKANEYVAPQPDRPWNTRDYCKLEAALRLQDYAIAFPEYPWLDPIAPFRGWDTGAPTKSLAWYDAYNAAKHDREDSADRATLECALASVASVVVIGLAQFGISYLRDAERWRHLFEVYEYPQWSIGDTHGRLYFPEQAGVAIPYPF